MRVRKRKGKKSNLLEVIIMEGKKKRKKSRFPISNNNSKLPSLRLLRIVNKFHNLDKYHLIMVNLKRSQLKMEIQQFILKFTILT
jgi:hypothetical protein